MTRSLEQIVHECLDNAVEGGYAITSLPDEEIADDLNRCAAECDLPRERLLPHIKSWRAKRG